MIVLFLFLGSIWYFSSQSDMDKFQELRCFTVANFQKEFNREKDDLLNKITKDLQWHTKKQIACLGGWVVY